jgi:ATP-dependent Clp protease ATP-binding subunit ClpA
MFERFTDRARRTVVLAQKEARELQHNYIGTEHLLLGLIGASEGVAARVLERYEMSLDAVREEVKARVGTGKAPVTGRIPFTPRSKKTMEFSLREALALSHNYIGTEHLLLGLLREGDGEGAQIIKAHAGDLLKVRMAVLDQVPAGRPGRTDPVGRFLHRRRAAGRALGEGEEPGQQPELAQLRLLESEGDAPHATPAAENSLSEAVHLAGGQAVGSHHLLLAALADPDTVAARTLAGLGVDLERARQALRQADVTGTSDEQPEDAGRRQMRIRISDGRLIIEASDPAILTLGRSAITALAEAGINDGDQPVITGDQPVSASLSDVWLAVRDSLDDIHKRAITIMAATAEANRTGTAGKAQPATPGTGQATPITGTDDD